ncbi:PREDICTED: uncharacterized protein LOC107603396 isoform X2 [Ficedula albicollis]|uniref:uncharacterized protein LOC107603396 isoform X2 n=1 Tax=Ficedula albicollis TaxID=59894 RepID=UPI0007AD7C87|nr:PREDICTED: uncharacterized protein LOC107603396 isoform X2 [Ficedula albicollis]
MDSKLPDENKQPRSENQHFKSFQTSPVSPRTKMGQKEVADFTSPMGKKELDRQTKETAVFHEYKYLKHQHVLCSEDIKNLQVCLQEPLRRLEEKNDKLIKEKKIILEGRKLIIQQEKILKDMQIKINHLHKQLKHPELIGSKNSKELQIPIEALGVGSSQEREIYNCLSSPAQKIAMVKRELCVALCQVLTVLCLLVLNTSFGL